MADLRIVDAPVLLQESITDDVKMPTGGLGNFSIRLGDIVWYVVAKEQLANKNYVDLSSKGVKDSLDEHIADKNNPHKVTKEQVGLGNVDNTADIDKPVSNATKSAIITATTDMATKAYVNQKDGDLTTLTTTDKTNLVKAINEVVSVKANKATTLLGYGISDAYTKSEIDTNYGGVKSLYDKNVEAGAGVNGWTDLLIALTSGRNLRDKLAEIASAKDYGAIGDGAADDTASIQNYANFLMSNGGGVLKLTKGNYRITSTIKIDGKVSIVGESGAKITVDANVEPFEIRNATGQGMTGLEIDGKDRAFYGMSIWNTEYYLIDNVHIHNTGGTIPMRGDGSGIRLIDSSFILITRTKTIDIGGDGILTLQSKYVVIDGCWSERCKRHNYSFSEYQSKKYSEHCKLINSVGIDAVLSGIDLESGVRCTVDNNTFIRSGKYLNTNDTKGDLLSAIASTGWSYGNRITNNTIIDSQTDGIFVIQATDIARTNEYGLEPVATVIADNYVLNTGRNGVFIAGNANQSNDKQSWNVHSNIIHNPAKNGIRLGWTTTNANIHNNTITNSGELAIIGSTNNKCNISHNNIDTNSDGISLEYSKNLIILANNININGTNKKYINIDMSANAAENIIIANNITNADLANNATLLNIFASGGGKNIKVHDNVGSGTGYPFITFNLGDFDKQTVKLEHNGFEYVKGAGWINKAELYITSVNSKPDYVGQMAIVSGRVYIATGTTANTDWKLVSNQTTA